MKDLNVRVYTDTLTGVQNKGGFDKYLGEIEQQIRELGNIAPFAIVVFDCDNLKRINDQDGHDKGNIYLKAASGMICSVFKHSPVFRIGGDEFTAVLQNQDFENRDALVQSFAEQSEEVNAAAQNSWEEVHVSLGIAIYDPKLDVGAGDTFRRADKLMYENKRKRKVKRG